MEHFMLVIDSVSSGECLSNGFRVYLNVFWFSISVLLFDSIIICWCCEGGYYTCLGEGRKERISFLAFHGMENFRKTVGVQELNEVVETFRGQSTSGTR